MILIQGYLKTSPESADRVRDAASPLIAATRREPGCIAYNFAQDIGEPGLIHIVERWADEAALTEHNKAPHLAAFMGALPGLGILGLRIARYEAGAEVVLAEA